MESAGGYGPLAASFSTGAATATLTDVKLAVFTSNPASGASFSVGLYSDSATSPVSLLDAIATVAENTLSSTVSVVDLTVGTPYVLAANTRYWIELAEPAGSAQWSWTADESGTGVSGESYVYSGSVLPNTDGP